MVASDIDDDEPLSADERVALIRDIANRIQQGNRKRGQLHLLTKPKPIEDAWDEADD